MLEHGNVQDNKNVRMRHTEFEKLDQEEIDDLRKLVHEHMRSCDVKRMDENNEGLWKIFIFAVAAIFDKV
jgi:hypothetical protein